MINISDNIHIQNILLNLIKLQKEINLSTSELKISMHRGNGSLGTTINDHCLNMPTYDCI